jgi:glycine/D-amino acid oxidase-like deaminating enzyme
VQLSDVMQFDDEADVVILGYGIAGACAALEARRAGGDVLVVERANGGGGASALSSGIFYIGGGTPVQAAAGTRWRCPAIRAARALRNLCSHDAGMRGYGRASIRRPVPHRRWVGPDMRRRGAPVRQDVAL